MVGIATPNLMIAKFTGKKKKKKKNHKKIKYTALLVHFVPKSANQPLLSMNLSFSPM